MQFKKIRENLVNVFLFISLAAFIVIAASSGLILKSEKNSIFDYTSMRVQIFSKWAGAALFPQVDHFALHFLINTLMLEKMTKYASILSESGRIMSHSEPEKIGDLDSSREAECAMNLKNQMMQTYKGADGLEYYYFSNPILVGKKRLGTVVLALNSETLDRSLSGTRRRLMFISTAALVVILLLVQLRHYMREEHKASMLKSAMVRTVSHEFNNALTVIDTALFMLEKGDSGKGEANRPMLYRTLESECKSLGNYVKNILNEARMEAGRFKLQKKELALRDIVSGAAYSMEGLMRQKHISFSLEMPDAPALVSADREALSLVVSNLMGNAVKYTPENGAISVKLTPDAEKQGRITFYIENSGNGIKPEEIRKIREEFYRTEEGRAVASGFGLGMKISIEMLLLHGSGLEIKSEPGKNSCFYFSLPIAAVKPAVSKEDIKIIPA